MATFVSGCLITNPVEFEQEEPVPPVILDVSRSDNPIGSILTINVVDEPGRIEIDVSIRDENLYEDLRARTRLVTADEPEPDYGETIKIPEQGTLLRDHTIRVETIELIPETCYQLEFVVSGSFVPGEDPDLFDVTGVADDIGRATWTIWDVSGDPFGDASGEAAKKLLDTCPASEATVIEGMEPAQ